MAPLAYLITFSCYGQRLHGDSRGSVDRFHNMIGGRYAPESAGRAGYVQSLMTGPAYELDAEHRRVVLEAVIDACSHRGWGLEAVHVRPTHVHAVVAADVEPDRIIERLKTNASWFLRKRFAEPARTRRWADGGSRRRFSDREALRQACAYVIHKQCDPMETYENRRARGCDAATGDSC